MKNELIRQQQQQPNYVVNTPACCTCIIQLLERLRNSECPELMEYTSKAYCTQEQANEQAFVDVCTASVRISKLHLNMIESGLETCSGVQQNIYTTKKRETELHLSTTKVEIIKRCLNKSQIIQLKFLDRILATRASIFSSAANKQFHRQALQCLFVQQGQGAWIAVEFATSTAVGLH
jgi:hypothetical protein